MYKSICFYLFFCSLFAVAQSIEVVGEVEVSDFENDSYISLEDNKVFEFGKGSNSVLYDFNAGESQIVPSSKVPKAVDFLGVQNLNGIISGFIRTSHKKRTLYRFESNAKATKPQLSIEKLDELNKRRFLSPYLFNNKEYFLATDFKKPLSIYDAVLPSSIGLTYLGYLIASDLLFSVALIESAYTLISPRPITTKPYVYTIQNKQLVDVSPAIFRSKLFKNYAALDAKSINGNFYVLLGSATKSKKKPIAVVEFDESFQMKSTEFFSTKKPLIVDYLKFSSVNEEGKLSFEGQSKPKRYNIIGQRRLFSLFKNRIIPRNLSGSIVKKNEKLRLTVNIESKTSAKQSKKNYNNAKRAFYAQAWGNRNLGNAKPSYDVQMAPQKPMTLNEIEESYKNKDKQTYLTRPTERTRINSTFDSTSVFGQSFEARIYEDVKVNFVEEYQVEYQGNNMPEARKTRSNRPYSATYSNPKLVITNHETGLSKTVLFSDSNFNITDDNNNRGSVRHTDVMFFNGNCYVAILTSDFKLKVYAVDLLGERFEIYSEDLDNSDWRTSAGEEQYAGANYTKNPFDFTYSLGHLGDGKFILKYRKYDRKFAGFNGAIVENTPLEDKTTVVKLYQILE